MPNKQTSNNKAKPVPEVKPKAKKRKSLNASQATIIAAILGLLGVTVGAIFTYWSVQTQVYAPIEATQTAQTFYFTQTALAFNANPSLAFTNTPETSAPIISTETATMAPQPNVNITRPKESDLNLVPTMYIGYEEIKMPEAVSYTTKVSRKQTYLWTYLWCAKYVGTLNDNLSVIKFSFIIDNELVPEEKFLVFKDPSTQNWECQRWTTMLSGWGAEPPTLTVLYEIPTPITDGVTTFPIGSYGHVIVVTYVD